jgi:hypothetical protein
VHFYSPGLGRFLQTDPIIKRAHYASRLEGAGVNIAHTESAVANDVKAMRGNLATNADVVGRLIVDGVEVEYRARLLPNGTVNVGTLFLDSDGIELSVLLHADENGRLLELEFMRWDSSDLLGPNWETLRLE